MILRCPLCRESKGARHSAMLRAGHAVTLPDAVWPAAPAAKMNCAVTRGVTPNLGDWFSFGYAENGLAKYSRRDRTIYGDVPCPCSLGSLLVSATSPLGNASRGCCAPWRLPRLSPLRCPPQHWRRTSSRTRARPPKTRSTCRVRRRLQGQRHARPTPTSRARSCSSRARSSTPTRCPARSSSPCGTRRTICR